MSESQVFKRVDSESLAVLDEQDEWATMKRKRRGKRQTGGQSEIGNNPTQRNPGSVPQPVETEAQPAEPLKMFQRTPPSPPRLSEDIHSDAKPTQEKTVPGAERSRSYMEPVCQ